MSSTWAGQNEVDRRIGEAWERQFEEMAERLGWPCHRPEKPEVWWPSRKPLPDRVVVREDGREWHELKHKRPTRNGEYGLEEYRLRGLRDLEQHVGEPVLYTIHDWQLSGATSSRDDTANRIEHWVTVDVEELKESGARAKPGDRTYFNSHSATTTLYYWPAILWEPLAWRWNIDVAVPKRPPISRPAGTPLGAPRLCPACAEWHPAGTTCAGGWAPWSETV